MKTLTLCAIRITSVCVMAMTVLMECSARADMIVWGNTEVINDRFGNPMVGGVITLWKDGGNGIIDQYATGDDVQIDVATSFSSNSPGHFYVLIDPDSVYQLSDGVRVYTRIFDAATIGASSFIADIGWTNIPPVLATVVDSTMPAEPWFYEVGGTRPDGKSWPPLTPTSFLDFGSTNLDFGSIEVGMTVTQQLALNAWYYQDMPYTRSSLALPYFSSSVTNGGIAAPGSENINIVCRPMSTGAFTSVLNVQYPVPVYGNIITLTSWVHAVGILTDMDDDQISDAWETAYFGNLTTLTNAMSDYDEDGLTDTDEWVAGTDPADPDSVLKGNVTLTTGSVFQIEWPSIGTATYTILTGTNLEQGVTGHLATAISGTPPVNSLSIPMPSDPRTFYRISVDQ